MNGDMAGYPFYYNFEVFESHWEGRRVRVVDKEGIPWFFSSDISVILGEQVKGLGSKVINIEGIRITIISLEALYKVLTDSSVREHQLFFQWLVDELLPDFDENTQTKANTSKKESCLESLISEGLTPIQIYLSSQTIAKLLQFGIDYGMEINDVVVSSINVFIDENLD